MIGLRKYLSPFIPDQSGAVATFFELGGIIVIIDAGGCVGNICGFDEPRYYNSSKSAIFSAALRDLDAILGRDDLLIDKIGDAIKHFDCKFIALVGTPIPAVIGTDYKALERMCENRYKVPTVSVDTNGIDLYDEGVSKALFNLFKKFSKEEILIDSFIGILGSIPQDLPSLKSSDNLVELIENNGFKAIQYDKNFESFKSAKYCKLNIVVSPSALKAARYLEKLYNIPYLVDYPISEENKKSLIKSISKILKIERPFVNNSHNLPINKDIIQNINGQKILIISQQVIANSLREILKTSSKYEVVDVASWFILDDYLKERTDTKLKEEDDLSSLVDSRKYDVVIGDPLLKRALPKYTSQFIALNHFAISGSLYQIENDSELLKSIL
ncbi:MAG: hypothetical protein JJE21_01695 [Spirochaetaceae bacterium]|nr:hypothetical protein [Spirochaetaceae bacterium]